MVAPGCLENKVGNCKFEKIIIMSSTRKKNITPGIKVVKNLPDLSNDPVFKKKAEDAAAFLKKHPLPESFKKKE
jgi:hypothetical protein